MTTDNLQDELVGADDKSLGRILRNTIDTIESSKSQIFDIYEAARSEVEATQKNLEELKKQALQIIAKVDCLEKLEQQEKQKLVHVSSNFVNYSEERIRESYEAVKNVQVQLGVAREKEDNVRRQRDKIEIKLQKLKKTLQVAERLAMRIGAVLGYLSSQVGDVVSKLENASKNAMLGAQIIKAQEEERYRVSREIHDGPAQDMANLIFQSSICERLIDIDPEEAKGGLQELRRQIRGCLQDIRQIIFDMRPMSLDDLGLVPAISQLISKLRERHILEASLSVEGHERDLSKHVEVSLFRIVQEALNNIHRHAGVNKGVVRVRYTDNDVAILITDEGAGFDVEEAEDSAAQENGNGHYGIIGMRERAKLVGAEFNILSTKGKGTRVHMKYSFKKQEDKETAKR